MDVLEYFKKKIEENPELREMYERKDYENLLFDIGNMVQLERMKNKMRQTTLAKKLKTSQSYISRLENGSFSPSLEKLQKIAEIFGGFVDISIQYHNKNNNETLNESCYYKIDLEEKTLFNERNLKIETINSKNKVLIS